jgi:thiosulfate/3-mercaptopyruvate sulfurtransferase
MLMTHTTLISTAELAQHLADPDWAIVDTRFSLTETEAGRRDYQRAHIPGAVYAHLDEDLSGPIIPGKTSRHPLPAIETFARTLSNWGIGAGTQVVVYDGRGGIIAGRLWWMLRWLGHDAVAVLDGGWPQWVKEGRPSLAGSETRSPRTFTPNPRPELLVQVEEVAAMSRGAEARLVDCRAWERYRGEQEPLDPVAGHIPGAICLPVTENLDSDERMLPPEVLRERFAALLGDRSPEEVVFYCGSGVSAAHNLLAMAHIGLDGARLYAGSWSEWITDSTRPVAVGDEGK